MAQLTLLGTVQEFCRRRSLPLPTSVITSTDETYSNILGILREACEMIAVKRLWRWRKGVLTFYHQGMPDYIAWMYPFTLALTLPFPSVSTQGGDQNLPHPSLSYGQWGIEGWIFDTMWDLTNRRPVNGPLSDADWEAMIATGAVPGVFSWRLRGPDSPVANQPIPGTFSGGGIQIYPNPVPQQSVQFQVEYKHSYYAANKTNLLPQYTFLDDQDFVMPRQDVVMSELTWRWKKEHGLPYAQDQADADLVLRQAFADEAGAGELKMDNDHTYPQVIKPGLLVPAGNWKLP